MYLCTEDNAQISKSAMLSLIGTNRWYRCGKNRITPTKMLSEICSLQQGICKSLTCKGHLKMTFFYDPDHRTRSFSCCWTDFWRAQSDDTSYAIFTRHDFSQTKTALSHADVSVDDLWVANMAALYKRFTSFQCRLLKIGNTFQVLPVEREGVYFLLNMGRKCLIT